MDTGVLKTIFPRKHKKVGKKGGTTKIPTYFFFILYMIVLKYNVHVHMSRGKIEKGGIIS